jgi:4-hydroxythreonine-4-phosphate dehydrogenase
LPCEIVTIGCPETLQERAKQLGIAIEITCFNPAQPPSINTLNTLKVLPMATLSKVVSGQLDKANARHVINMLDVAIQGCQSGIFDALVTAPVQKSILNDAGIPFSGHTEYLADSAGIKKVVMMLATTHLRVALATTHLPLREVADAITAPLLTEILHILETDLKRYFGLPAPRILVSGLNPHAGEGGHLGREEIDIISPVIETLKQGGMHLTGPLPADTLFTRKYLDHADAVLAMYHDQGLPVLKYQGFGQAANITLGLPFIRTSVDHGTALDLAGTGNIDCGSLLTAITIALQMAAQRA